MAEIKLFSLNEGVKECTSSEVVLEKELQTLIEQNMEIFFGVRFLKSEYVVTNGRMDSIGIDENNSPVIFEYKRSQNENVINQGLFYLDWLLDHKADFKLLVIDKLGKEAADNIDWSVPCVICVAHDFTKYDMHAVNQMQRNIKLVSYRRYDNGMLLLEHLNTPIVKPIMENMGNENDTNDIVSNQLKLYLAYKKVQNMVCIEIYKKQIMLFLKINPDTVKLENGFTRDMRNIGHYGTGDLQITIKNAADFERAKPLLERAYNEI